MENRHVKFLKAIMIAASNLAPCMDVEDSHRDERGESGERV